MHHSITLPSLYNKRENSTQCTKNKYYGTTLVFCTYTIVCSTSHSKSFLYYGKYLSSVVLPYHYCTIANLWLTLFFCVCVCVCGGVVTLTKTYHPTSTWYLENTMVKTISVSWYMLKYHSITITLSLYYLKGPMVKNRKTKQVFQRILWYYHSTSPKDHTITIVSILPQYDISGRINRESMSECSGIMVSVF